jgi:putative phosphoesterase
MRIGLISDTHGLLRPEAVDALRRSDHILHAGDIGDAGILRALADLAPVTAVRGNNDAATWADDLPEACLVEFEGVAVYMLHDLQALEARPAPAHARVIVAGHSHRPLVETRDGVLVVNPGSAGRRRFSLPVTVGELRIAAGAVEAHVIGLAVAPRG